VGHLVGRASYAGSHRMSCYDYWKSCPLDSLDQEIKKCQARFKQRRVLPADMTSERVYLANLKSIAALRRKKGER